MMRRSRSNRSFAYKQASMKTIISPSIAEVVHYSCDITGAQLPHGPPVVITIKCGFGSVYDGDTFELHLSEDAAEVVLPLLRSLLLKGAPIEPYRTDCIFDNVALYEKRISCRENASLLRKLDKLCHQKKLKRVAAKKECATPMIENQRHRGLSSWQMIRRRLFRKSRTSNAFKAQATGLRKSPTR